jgi:hypothetical protein
LHGAGFVSPVVAEGLVLAGQYFRDAARVPHHEQVLVKVRDVQIPRVLQGLGDRYGRLVQNGEALVRFAQPDVGLDLEPAADLDGALGPAQKLDGHRSLDPGLTYGKKQR